jgi:hypothetical protein
MSNRKFRKTRNTKGYISENVVSCCGLCNSLKRDNLSPEETLAVISAIIEYRKNNNATR